MAEESSNTNNDQMGLLVSQNNDKRTVKIKEVSESLSKALGWLRSEMEGKALSDFLGAKVAEMLDEYLEYDDHGSDIDDILGRTREFSLKNHKGGEVLFAHKCYREAPRDTNQWFRLVLKDERRQIEEQSITTLLRDNLAGVMSLDESTGLADQSTCQRYLDQVANYVGTHGARACFATLRMDRYEKSLKYYGAPGCQTLMQHIAQHCKGKFREEDLVSRLNDQTLGLLLMDIGEESARIVLNRLKGSIGSHRIAFGGKSNFSITVSISFMEMSGESGEEVMQKSLDAINGIEADARSALVSVAS